MRPAAAVAVGIALTIAGALPACNAKTEVVVDCFGGCGGEEATGGSGGRGGSGGQGGLGGSPSVGGGGGSGGSRELPMTGSEVLSGGGGVPGDWSARTTIVAEGRFLTSDAPAIFDTYEQQPGWNPMDQLTLCADENGGHCLGGAFAVSIGLKVPDGVDPLQRRYFVGNPHILDNNAISAVAVSTDGVEWLKAGSGVVSVYRDGPGRFSGSLAVDLVDDESKFVRKFEATFGGNWSVWCSISFDPPRDGEWREGNTEHPFCEQFEKYEPWL